MKKYTYNEVLVNSLKYFKDEIAANVWISKYAMKDSNGVFYENSPVDMHKRMAKEFNKVEEKYKKKIQSSVFDNLSKEGQKYITNGLDNKKIYDLFKGFNRIIPQGSVMSQLGHKFSIGSLSNCTVVNSPYDSYNGIILADLELANLMKRRCGVGIDISTLRPLGAKVSNAAATSTGAVSFLERYSNTTKEVSQNGRRGALMTTISINHPNCDIFATIKSNQDKVNGANISILLSDEFMNAVKADTDFLHIWPIDSNKKKYDLSKISYNTIIEKNGIYIKKIKAKNLWNIIVKAARDYAEPGLVFWDRQHKYSTSSVYPKYKNVSLNPCAEIAMGGDDSCRLISTNMFKHVDNAFLDNASFNFEKWKETIYYAQILNDDLVDLEIDSINRIINKINNDTESESIKAPEIKMWKNFKEIGEAGRRTGLGFTGLGDTIAALNLKYDSDEALKITDLIMKAKFEAEINATIDLAILRGKFKDFNVEIENTSDFVKMMKLEFPELYKKMMKFGRRNIATSTVAPSGSLSMLAGNVTSGIEPLFMPFYKRRKKINIDDINAKVDFKDADGVLWQEFNICHPNFKKWINLQDSSIVVDKLNETQLQTWFEKSPYFNSTAYDIDWHKRIKMQSIVQKYVQHSISSTINLSKDVTEETVSQIYFNAWEQKLKGITVYRDGSRNGILISNKGNDKQKTIEEFFSDNTANFRDFKKIIKVQAPKRPTIISCEIHNLTAKGKRWTVLIGMLKDDPYEVWAYMNKGIDVKEKFGKILKFKKGAYRLLNNADETIVENLNDLMSDEEENLTRQMSLSLRTGADIKYVVNGLNKSKGTIVSFAKAIARTLSKYVILTKEDYENLDKKCPECGDPTGLVYENGCVYCHSCGYQKCS